MPRFWYQRRFSALRGEWGRLARVEARDLTIGLTNERGGIVNEDLIAGVERLRRFVDGKSHAISGCHPNGFYFVEVNIAAWEGRYGYSLLWEGVRFLWKVFRCTLWHRFIRAEPQQEGAPDAR